MQRDAVLLSGSPVPRARHRDELAADPTTRTLPHPHSRMLDLRKVGQIFFELFQEGFLLVDIFNDLIFATLYSHNAHKWSNAYQTRAHTISNVIKTDQR